MVKPVNTTVAMGLDIAFGVFMTMKTIGVTA